MERLERVARAITRARGLDPDADSGQGEWTRTTDDSGPAPTITLERQPWPVWRLCEADAREFIAAYDALAS